MIEDGRAASPPGPKRLLFAALLAAGIALLAEAGAFAAFWALDGEPFGWARLRAEQAGVAALRPPDAESPEPPAGYAGVAGRATRRQVVHPYQGYVYDPAQSTAADPISAWGFRDDAPPFYRRASDRLIVAVTGGSFAMHFTREAGERLAQRLEQSERFAGREVVIANLALSGYKQPQQVATLAWLLALGAEFDVLVNLDGFNEVALHGYENAPNGVHPAYPRAWFLRTLRVPDPARHARLGEVAYLTRERARAAERVLASPLRASVLANLVWRAWDRRLQHHLAAAERAARAPAGAGGYQNTGPPFAARPVPELFDELVRLWSEGSRQLERLARANGIAYYHFLQPTQHVSDSKPMGPDERRVAFGGSPYAPGARTGYPLLIRAGAELAASGVAFRDLTAVFAEVEEPLYRDACCHVNERGNRIVADAIADFILASEPARPRGALP